MSKKLACSSYIKATVLKEDVKGVHIETTFLNVTRQAAAACIANLMVDFAEGDETQLQELYALALIILHDNL